MALRIILADDHPIVRSGVRALLERSTSATIVAEVDSPDALIKTLEQQPCDLLLTDFNMPGGQITDGLNLLGLVQRRWPDLPVVVLTMVSNLGVLRSILSSGVRGLLNKSDALNELPLAVNAAAHGRVYVSAALKELLETNSSSEPGQSELQLSKRETEVLRLFASGLTVSQIATQLNRSVKTISRQKMDAMNKLGLKSDLDIYAYARENGLFS